MAPTAFFEPSDDGRLYPTRYSHSLWAPNTLHGPAVCGVAARRAEAEFGRNGFRPARFTIDLFKAARTDPTDTVGRVVRDGGRIRVVEVDVVQYRADSPEPVTVGRSTTVFVRESTNPPGERWERPAEYPTGPEVPADDLLSYFSRADDADPVWSHDMSPMQAPVRKRLWTAGVPIVTNEPLTPFVRTVIAAESTSLVGNWGSGGIGFINCDLTVVLARLPHDGRVIVETDSHVEFDGISTSTASLYDASGQFATGAVVGVNNAAAEIDFTVVDTRERYAEG
ncbi:hypothetical protein GOEFS_018_00770 [Gordonia effusa NBRC 100432]|uniref:Acyl-CoA thioesterase-like N-terminal HotDog domain-containing protein n=1 Tax=Gordonia effusa NBRC 100432 TaxID=1077974 RepID=H0QW44_9ACTN|nr:acyl-CoA thioesterase domain-containing protein [Gordonia effusa]GAB17045.1 hypothetical protein GOEFS_018_00770 [Gordonia effusa NBRC 100432]